MARYATPADLVLKRGPAAPADGDGDDADSRGDAADGYVSSDDDGPDVDL